MIEKKEIVKEPDESKRVNIWFHPSIGAILCRPDETKEYYDAITTKEHGFDTSKSSCMIPLKKDDEKFELFVGMLLIQTLNENANRLTKKGDEVYEYVKEHLEELRDKYPDLKF